MPRYKVRDPQTGRTVTLAGDSPPTEAELTDIFAKLPTGTSGAAPAAPADPQSTIGGRLRSSLGQVADVGIGVVKGAGQTASNLGRLVHAIPGVSRAVDYAMGAEPGMSQAAFKEADTVLAPTNTEQKLGKIGEQIAEVAIPAGATRRAGVAAAEFIGPKIAGVVGQRAAAAIPNVAVQAASGAGSAAAQGGNPLVGGAFSAVGPVVGEALEHVPASLRETAGKRVQQALGATKERYKAMAAKLGPEIQKRGLGGSREALQAQAAATLETVGGQLDEALQKYGGQVVPTAAITDALEGSKAAFRTVTTMPVSEAAKKGLLQKATSVKDGVATIGVDFDPRSLKQLDSLQKVIGEVGDTATVGQLVGIRRAWDKIVDQAGGFSHRAGGAIGVPLKEQSEAWAKREATGAIRKLLAEEVPDLAAINKEFAFWKNLDDVLQQSMKRTQPQGPGLLSQVAGGAGAVVGGTVGGVGGALAFGRLGKMAQTVLTSPRMRFVDAKLRNSLADAIEGGSHSELATVLGRISAVQGSKIGSTPIGAVP